MRVARVSAELSEPKTSATACVHRQVRVFGGTAKSSAEVTQTGGRVGRRRGPLTEISIVTYEAPLMPRTSEGTQGKFLRPKAASQDPRPPAAISAAPAALAHPRGQLSGPAVSGGVACLRCASVPPGRGCSAQQDPGGRRVTEVTGPGSAPWHCHQKSPRPTTECAGVSAGQSPVGWVASAGKTFRGLRPRDRPTALLPPEVRPEEAPR